MVNNIFLGRTLKRPTTISATTSTPSRRDYYMKADVYDYENAATEVVSYVAYVYKL
jgi:hypothetical protein